jgi:hypothetical protein
LSQDRQFYLTVGNGDFETGDFTVGSSSAESDSVFADSIDATQEFETERFLMWMTACLSTREFTARFWADQFAGFHFANAADHSWAAVRVLLLAG